MYQALSEDHSRLDLMLLQIAEGSGEISSREYAEFRMRQMRHIFVEERFIFPAIVTIDGGRESPVVLRLRLDHRALGALVVLPPTQGIIRLLRHILRVHHAIEEEEGGMYWRAVEAIGAGFEEVLEALNGPFAVDGVREMSGPAALREARLAVRRAGYDFMEW